MWMFSGLFFTCDVCTKQNLHFVTTKWSVLVTLFRIYEVLSTVPCHFVFTLINNLRMSYVKHGIPARAWDAIHVLMHMVVFIKHVVNWTLEMDLYSSLPESTFCSISS